MTDEEKKEEEKKELNVLLHTLWGKAKDTPTYDKSQWNRIQQLIEMRVYVPS